jgi:Ino eighty subunit 2
METINKLLKKQAPKTTRKNALLAAQEEAQDTEPQRPDPMCVRWINNRSGSLVAVPEELLAGPAGSVFLPPNGGVAPRGRGLGMGKMVEEVSCFV